MQITFSTMLSKIDNIREIYFKILKYGEEKKRKIFLEEKSKKHRHPIDAACVKGDIFTVKKLLRDGEFIQKENWEEAIYYACKYDHESLAKFLIEENKSPSSAFWEKGYYGSCKSGNTNLLEFFTNKSVIPYRYLEYGFEKACEKGKLDAINLLIDKGCCSWDMSLHAACKGGQMKVIELMLSKGASDLDLGLFFACSEGQFEVAKFLINKGTRIEKKHLGAACFYGDLEIVKFLKNKMGVSKCDWRYILRCACRSGNLELVKYIMQRSVEIDFCNLMNACASGNIEVIEYLANKEKFSKKDWTHALKYASLYNTLNLDIVKYIIKNGAKIKNISLINTCCYGNSEVLNFLLKYRELKNKYLDECLYEASMNGKLDMVKILIKIGATNVKEAASETRYKKVRDYLLSLDL